MTREIIRKVRLVPYLPGNPYFTLSMWDTGRTHPRGTPMLGYQLRQHERGQLSDVLFEGEDYSASPLHATDSDDTVAGLMGFLTLKPGDTDREYFQDYTPAQMAFVGEHAEALSSYCVERFGEG